MALVKCKYYETVPVPVVEPFVCSRNIIISVIYSSLYLFYNLIHLSAMLGFCRIYVRLKIKKEQKTCFKTLDKGRRWEHFMLRVRGLILASDRDYEKHDA